MESVTIALGLISLLEKVMPYVDDAVKKGLVSAEVQANLKSRIDALRKGLPFEGDEWKD